MRTHIAKYKKPFFLLFLVLLVQGLSANTNPEIDLLEKMTNLVIQIGIILFAARLGGSLMKKIHMPSVLGELLMGIIIGPYLLGGLIFPGFPHGLFPVINPEFPISPELYGLATVASIILLFHSGLETDITLFLRYSAKGAVIGIGGVLLSLLTGAWVAVLITGEGIFAPTNLFLGVISVATSVGITARILSEQRKMDSPEGVTILAAAVIDDVVGIIILAVVLGVVAAVGGAGGEAIAWSHIGFIAFKAIAVWLFFMIMGLIFARKIAQSLKIFKSENSIAVMSLGLALLLSGIFEKAGLAMIIGAYVMGLSLSRTDLNFVIQEKIHPLQEFFVPIFFTVMGMLVNLEEALHPSSLLLGLIFTVVGILAKLIGCGVPSLFMGFNWMGASRIGVGMIPRGEVALIIAGIGISGGILTSAQFGIVILMTLITTIVPPPLLSILLRHKKIGTKTPEKGSDTQSNFFDFSSSEMNKMALSRILISLQNEGFYIHELALEYKLYQVRKDEIFLTIHDHKKGLEIISPPEDSAYIQTLVYETIVELNETLHRVKDSLQPEKLKEGLGNSSLSQTRLKENQFQIIQEKSINIALQSTTKEDIIKELLDSLDQQGLLKDPQACFQDVWAREQSMGTGMQEGIALPHGKSKGVTSLQIAIGLKKEGVDFAAFDKKPSQIFVLILAPEDGAQSHLQFLSAIATVLNQAPVRQKILASTDPKQLKNILLQSTHTP